MTSPPAPQPGLERRLGTGDAVVIGLALISLLFVAADKPAASTITFTKDVAPILFKSCAECHRPGEIGPMSLMSYQEARPWAKAIRERIVDRSMPPWSADPNHGEWANDPRLSQKEIDTVIAWVNELSEGKMHHFRDMPVVLAGSCGGYFKTGQYVKLTRFDDPLANSDKQRIEDAPHNKLLTMIANAAGVYATPQAVLVNARRELVYRGNYNTSRYCSNPETEYVRIALESLVGRSAPANLPESPAYGCELPSNVEVTRTP